MVADLKIKNVTSVVYLLLSFAVSAFVIDFTVDSFELWNYTVQLASLLALTIPVSISFCTDPLS